MDNQNCFLFDERPLIIRPELACIIGLNESIVIQQIHYWIKKNEENNANLYDGRYWTYDSISAWHKKYFRFWSRDTVKRTFNALEKSGVLLCGNYNKGKFDNTKWYTIDYKRLDEIVAQSVRANCPSDEEEKYSSDHAPAVGADCPSAQGQSAPTNREQQDDGPAMKDSGLDAFEQTSFREGNLHQTRPETLNTEISTETPADQKPAADKSADCVFERLWQLYPRKRGKDRVSKKSKQAIRKIGFAEMQRAINRYLAEKKGKDPDYLCYGSTFFTSTYKDFLDNAYEPLQMPVSVRAEAANRPVDDEVARRKRELGVKEAAAFYGYDKDSTP